MKTSSSSLLAASICLVGFLSQAQDSKDATLTLSDVSRASQFAIVHEKSHGEWTPLLEQTPLYNNSQKYHWEKVPAELAGTHFLALPIHHGVLEFEASSDGYVFLITSDRWGGGGNSSGDWVEEVMLERDLRKDGWREMRGLDDLITSDPGEMKVFWRYCKTGEAFRIRTEKYVAPMLLTRPLL